MNDNHQPPALERLNGTANRSFRNSEFRERGPRQAIKLAENLCVQQVAGKARLPASDSMFGRASQNESLEVAKRFSHDLVLTDKRVPSSRY
jgi:hypothetical protein